MSERSQIDTYMMMSHSPPRLWLDKTHMKRVLMAKYTEERARMTARELARRSMILIAKITGKWYERR